MVIFPSTRSLALPSTPLTAERRRKIPNIRKAARFRPYNCSILRIESHKTLERSHPTRPRYLPFSSEPANVELTITLRNQRRRDATPPHPGQVLHETLYLSLPTPSKTQIQPTISPSGICHPFTNCFPCARGKWGMRTFNEAKVNH